MTQNQTTTKQASDFDNFAYNIAPQFEDGFYGYAVDKDFSMSIVQMYLDCETEEDEKRVDRALRKLRNFHLSMDRGHLKNKAKYLGEEGMFKESNFKDYVKRQNEKYSTKTAEAEEQSDNDKQEETTRPTRPVRVDNNITEEEQKQQQQVETMNNDEYEKAIAMKRLVGLTGLKRAAMAATIEKYFSDRQKARELYPEGSDVKFAYTLDDYINGARI